MTTMILIFTAITFVNVIISTTRSLFTVKGGKWSAAIVNAVCYGFYTYVIVLTATSDFSTSIKALITFVCNLGGVLLVKFVEEKMRKDKVWLFTATCNKNFDVVDKVVNALKDLGIKLVYNEIVKDQLYTLNIYSKTQKESLLIEDIMKTYELKYCACETTLVGE